MKKIHRTSPREPSRYAGYFFAKNTHFGIAPYKLDDVRNVGIRDGRIVTVTRDKLSGDQSVDAQGLVVAPGFIDWHSHEQNNLADRVHALNGVTTVLELEAGILPVGRWYDIQAKNRRVLNYAAASSWVFARLGIPLSPEPRIQLLFFTAFDLATLQDRATYDRPNQTSVGMRHVLVNGRFVIRDGELDTKTFPGKPVRRTVSRP